MKARHTTRIRLLATVTAVAVAALAAGSGGSARVRIPEEPEVTIGTPAGAANVAAAQDPQLGIVSLGRSDRYGFELFATTRNGQIVGKPMG